jgi:hypothetical protein
VGAASSREDQPEWIERNGHPYESLKRKSVYMDKKKLEDKLRELDEKIVEINKRMPAHSVKPPIMTELFELEDEREALFKQLEVLKQKKT